MRTATARQTNEDPFPRAAWAADFADRETEEKLLQMNLAGLKIPTVQNLSVDALKPSWLERLFGRR